MASVIRKPLYMDSITLVGDRLDFVKVCVEIDSSSTFPGKIEFALSNGEYMDIVVEYARKPKACPWCNIFGHDIKDCLSALKENKDGFHPPKPKQTHVWNVVNRKKNMVLGNEFLDSAACNKLD